MNKQTNIELLRFILTGLISNTLSFMIFLFAIYVLDVGHKTAATILFLIAMLINYLINKKWTFNKKYSSNKILPRYILTYFVGYFLNIAILALFVDFLNFRAGWVQFFAIGILVIYYFVLNKYFVFKG